MDRLALKTQIERLALGTDHGCGPRSEQGFTRRVRPGGNSPPGIEAANGLHVRTGDHDWRAIVGAGHHVGKRNGDATASQRCLHAGQSVRGKGMALFCDHHNVGAVFAKFRAQLALHVHVEVQHGGGDGRGDHHGQQRGKSTPAAHQRGSQQHAQEHPVLARTASWGRGAHASAFNAYTGSKRMARRMATALPAKVTNVAIPRMTGKSTGSTLICELKMLRPISRASRPPPKKPTIPPIMASKTASAKKTEATVMLAAPSAFIKPISLRRSKMAVAMAAETASAEASSAASVISSIRPLMRSSTVPSVLATWRMGSTRAWGSDCCRT